MSRKIAFGGIFTALTVVLLYMGAFVPSGKLALYALSSLPIAFTIIEFGAGAGFTVYIAASILAFLLVGNISAVLPFIVFFGHYGLLKFFIEKRKGAAAEVLLKLAAFNGSLGLWYIIFTGLLGLNPLPGMPGTSGWLILLLAGAQIVFFIYDYVFTRLIMLYIDKADFLRLRK